MSLITLFKMFLDFLMDSDIFYSLSQKQRDELGLILNLFERLELEREQNKPIKQKSLDVDR